MTKEIIKKKLEDLGYKMFNKHKYIWGGIEGHEGPVPGYNIINSGFNIFFENNKVLVIMLNSIVGKKEEFNNEKDLIDFIKENAPIK